MASSLPPAINRATLFLLFALAALLGGPAVASAAGETISGTVRNSAAAPAQGVCVTADGGPAGSPQTTTAADGTYLLNVVPGDYVVSFDDCGTLTYVREYYDNASSPAGATTVTVAPGGTRSGIDAQLADRPTDTTPPETSIVTGPQANQTDPNVTFEFASDNGDETFRCSLDGAAFHACSSPDSYGPLADGPHHFEVFAIDPAGNADPTPATSDFTVDSTAPDTTITNGPSGTVTTRNVTFDFTSSNLPSTFICRLDGNATPCSSPKSYTLPDGPHQFSVFATDSVGNSDQTPATRSFYIDTSNNPDDIAPQTTITAGPTGTISTTGTTFEFSANEFGSRFECALDGGTFTACTTPFVQNNLTDGVHTFSVRAIDAAGNVDQTPASRGFTVDSGGDTTAPEATIIGGPNGTIAETFASFSFDSNESGSTFECSFDGPTFSPCTSPRSYSGLTDGNHLFQVRAIDPSGNVGAPVGRTFNVDTGTTPLDTTPPNTTIESGPEGTISFNSAIFEFDSDETGSTFKCSLDGSAFAPCTSPRSLTGLSEGDHTFRVYAIDPAGNADATPDAITFTVQTTPPADTVAPQTTIDSGPSGPMTSTSASFTFSASETGSTFRCKLDSGAWTACTSPQSYSGLSSGDHSFQVAATDTFGNLDGSPALRSFTVEQVITPPPPPPPTSDSDCTDAQNQLATAQKALDKAKASVKKAKSKAAKKKAKKKLKAAKSRVSSAQAAVAAAC
jgi:hypothetical protein